RPTQDRKKKTCGRNCTPEAWSKALGGIDHARRHYRTVRLSVSVASNPRTLCTLNLSPTVLTTDLGGIDHAGLLDHRRAGLRRGRMATQGVRSRSSRGARTRSHLRRHL